MGGGGLAQTLVMLRREGRAVAAFPGTVPATAAEAYRVQAAALALLKRDVGGWKVGLVPPAFRELFGGTRLFGPILAENIRHADGATLSWKMPGHGFAAFEAEIALRIGRTAQPSESWTAATAAGAVDSAMIAVELASSPIASIRADGPCAIVADLGINAGLLLGSALGDWRDALASITVCTTVDGDVAGPAKPMDMPGGPLESLASLLNHLGARGLPLEAGQVVATGAITGIRPIGPGMAAVADFGAAGAIAVRTTAE